METSDLAPLLEELEGSVDELEDVLAPLLSTKLSDITSKLPLLDRAKLHVLVTYGIESILFAYLKLNGVDARNHPVFTELTRVKQYFEKIKEAENGGPEKRDNLKLDKDAAGRFIKHALAGNDQFDRKRAEQRAEQRVNAQKKIEETSEQVGTTQRFKHLSHKRKVDHDGVDATEPELVTPVPSATAENLGSPEGNHEKPAEGKPKKKKKQKISAVSDATEEVQAMSSPINVNAQEQQPGQSQNTTPQLHKKKKHKTSDKSHKMPKSGSTVFQELLNKPAKG